MKKITIAILALTLCFALAACGSDESGSTGGVTTPATTAGADGSGDGVGPSDELRTIRVGLWFDEYYDSTHTSIDDNPSVSDAFRAQMEFDNLKEVEQRYNVRIEYINLTWEGTIESINTSIMAGSPDCDIYMTDLQFGIPATLNGFAQALNHFLPSNADVLNEQRIMKHLNLLGDPNNYLFTPEARVAEGYPLGFNLDLIKANNLEDPRELFDRGEWTWEVWREQMLTLTKDDVYGYGGYWTNMLENMLLANNAHIAGDKTQGIDSPQTIEVMEFFYNIYNVDRTARPWIQEDWESNLRPFVNGSMAFFVTKDWIIQNFSDSGNDLEFELGVVPWPHGPSGNKESSMKYTASGNWHIIPVGIANPEFVYNVFHDYKNWFKDDVDLRDEGGTFDWQADMYLTERNFEMAIANGSISAFDIWSSLGLGDDLSMVPIMDGEKTPAQYAEEQKQIIQDRLDAYFGN